MDNILPDLLLKVILISTLFSVVEVTIVQKIKTVFTLKKKWQVILINFISSFIFGILFSMWFFNLNILNSLWVSFFSFIGAPSIYEGLRKQNIIDFTPKSLSDINDTK